MVPYIGIQHFTILYSLIYFIVGKCNHVGMYRNNNLHLVPHEIIVIPSNKKQLFHILIHLSHGRANLCITYTRTCAAV